MKIIYINDQGGVSVVHPTPEALAIYGIEAIAIKDVPGPREVFDVPTGTYATHDEAGNAYPKGEEPEIMAGRIKTYPFKIVEDDAVPATREERAAWVVDPLTLTDGVGGESDEFEVEVSPSNPETTKE